MHGHIRSLWPSAAGPKAQPSTSLGAASRSPRSVARTSSPMPRRRGSYLSSDQQHTSSRTFQRLSARRSPSAQRSHILVSLRCPPARLRTRLVVLASLPLRPVPSSSARQSCTSRPARWSCSTLMPSCTRLSLRLLLISRQLSAPASPTRTSSSSAQMAASRYWLETLSPGRSPRRRSPTELPRPYQ